MDFYFVGLNACSFRDFFGVCFSFIKFQLYEVLNQNRLLTFLTIEKGRGSGGVVTGIIF